MFMAAALHRFFIEALTADIIRNGKVYKCNMHTIITRSQNHNALKTSPYLFYISTAVTYSSPTLILGWIKPLTSSEEFTPMRKAPLSAPGQKEERGRERGRGEGKIPFEFILL